MNSQQTNRLKQACAAGILLAGWTPWTSAQSVDALLDKLVDKGVLTVKEAKDLRVETAKKPSTVTPTKTGLPDWVSSLKFSGDFRGRFEANSTDNTANVFPNGAGTFGPAVDRNRWRYRVRFGAKATLLEDFEVGLRLASGNLANNSNPSLGGNTVSANTDMGDFGSRKYIWLDAAYGKWTPFHTETWLAGMTVGKMDNPFQISNMVFDHDVQLEGVAFQTAYRFSPHTLKLNGGAFVLDEFNQPSVGNPSASHDPFLLGGQVLLETKWSPKFETSLGISAFTISGKENLGTGSAPNINDGNTRNALGFLENDYSPIVGSGSLTYKLSSFPFYKGEFPLKLAGEWMENPGAASRNTGYWAGVTFGKSGAKGAWDLSYKWQSIEGDAWYDEFPDNDYGAFYQAGTAGGGFVSAANPAGAGYRGGTNVKGHVIKGTYSFTDAVSLSLTYYLTELVSPLPVSAESGSGHVMVDLMWKF